MTGKPQVSSSPEIRAAEAFESRWTVKDVAIYLRVSTWSVYKKAEAGVIPSVHIGRLLRFDPAVIREWAAKGGSS